MICELRLYLHFAYTTKNKLHHPPQLLRPFETLVEVHMSPMDSIDFELEYWLPFRKMTVNDCESCALLYLRQGYLPSAAPYCNESDLLSYCGGNASCGAVYSSIRPSFSFGAQFLGLRVRKTREPNVRWRSPSIVPTGLRSPPTHRLRFDMTTTVALASIFSLDVFFRPMYCMTLVMVRLAFSVPEKEDLREEGLDLRHQNGGRIHWGLIYTIP